MKITRMFILAGIFLLSLGLVSGTLATANATREVIVSPVEATDVDETAPQIVAVNGDPAYDLGDAPDSTNHSNDTPMTAYFPSRQGKFPTVYDPSLTPPSGPRHAQPLADAWLGLTVTLEYDADLLPDNDGVTNLDPDNDLADQDEGDDGIIPGTMNLNHCESSDLWVEVNIVGGRAARYLNVWFDWNQDGDWEDVFGCPRGESVSEWSVQNYSFTSGIGKHAIPLPSFYSFLPQGSWQIWMRVFLSPQPAPLHPDLQRADGRGPEVGYDFGETEDYLIESQTTPDVDWDKWVNGEPWHHAISVTVETSDTIQVVDVITVPVNSPVDLVERWNPQQLDLIGVNTDAGKMITGTGVLTWSLPENAGVVTITKFFHVEPCDWEYTILEEEYHDPQYPDPVYKPVIIYKLSPELSIDSVNNTDAYVGNPAGFTLVYSNTGGYENDVWIQNLFPPEAPFRSSSPAPDHVAEDGSEAIWELGDLAMGDTDSIDVQVAITDSLEVSSTIVITDGIYNHLQELVDTTVISYHVEEFPEHDIYVKDSTSDDGSVPSSAPFWVSPDIWVRNSKDGGFTHQNPKQGETNFIYVRVRNRMPTTVSDIKMNVYWTSAALGTGWPAGWGYIGYFNIPSLAPGAVYIGWVQWDTPAISGHFCLRVRTDSPDDPIGSGPDTIAPTDLVNNNNNISMRNLNIIDFPEVRECSFVTTTVYTEEVYMDAVNLSSTTASVDIVLDSDDFPLTNGEIVLNPGDLWGRWNALANFDQVGTMLIPTGFPAVISDVQMMPDETVRMTMTISAEGDEGFMLDVEERVNGKIVGGIRYVRVMPDCVFMPLIPNTQPQADPVPEAYLPSSDRFGWLSTDQ